jgi:hypothetical protein
MSDEYDDASDAVNDQLVLISGESASGKSASLQNLRGGPRVLYLNCESGKRLPFRNNFTTKVVTDPYQIHEAFEYTAEDGKGEFDTIVIDTLTFLMDMYESQYIIGAADTMKGWANYQQFFKKLMQEYVAESELSVVFLAHTRSDLNEAKMEMETCVPVKGALKNNGIESYFSTVVSTKKMGLKALGNYQNDLLHITEDDELLEYKHVFQTRLTKETKGERIRSPMGMFTKEETYMDNDAQLLLDHLAGYYG